MKTADLVELLLDVQARSAVKNHNLAPRDRDREVMRAVLRVAASRIPAMAAHLEDEAPAAILDELRSPRLELRAAPIIEAVAREATAATGADVTAALLRRSARTHWLTPWRREAWARMHESGMSMEEVGLVFGVIRQAVSAGLAARRAAANESVAREVSHGARN